MGQENTQQSTEENSGIPQNNSRSGPNLPAMFERYKGPFERELHRTVPTPENSQAYILLRYHLGWVDRAGGEVTSPVSRGKALRPTLCLFACDALANDYSKALPAAAALELIHNFLQG